METTTTTNIKRSDDETTQEKKEETRQHVEDKLVDKNSEGNIVPLQTIKRDDKPSKGMSDNIIKPIRWRVW